MPNLEGNCSNCKDYASIDHILIMYGDTFHFCCLRCLYEFICREHKGE